ncbi:MULTISPECIES: helix-turn-helix transcriptional regulator [unclassified Streptomyces]|uniref:helix-turn-helix domain-containing protein n=1 Tax=unclassified Streptomyces TaxID=2593676 RepID=UPI002366BA6F|nr:MULTISPECIES: helix-turn-helix transcriptional regulator [unclassified Streptomyces]MDF3140641.1 helix-turn-helix transcriptional regulator [Streptomyces sp. T21Q-yed]WDF39963.1 helix-turn-helix transcriptional regulator [Streptomyces sp. T12]
MSSHVAPDDQATSGLDRRSELREFLRSRRARLRPEDVGLPSYGRRRVPGLRREELAQLAGVSYAYYARLEQGHGETMSADVLDAVAHALSLSEEEREHLVRLAQPERQGTPQAAPPPQRLRPSVQHLLDGLGVPAYVVSRRLDILGWNRLAATVFGDWAQLMPEERNIVRLIFLSPETRDRFADPERTALTAVGALRMNAGKSPEDSYLSSLFEELSQKSEEFRRLWARHEVSCGTVGDIVRMRHPLVGEFDLVHEPMALRGGAPMRLVTYHAEPGSRSEEALRMLASWELEPQR